MHRLPPNELTLLLIVGTPGTGKTTLARTILRHRIFVYLDNNFIADAFFPSTRTSSEYAKIRPSLYKAFYRVTEENLAVGNSVLLDAPHVTQMTDAAWRSEMIERANKAAARLVVLRCYCEEMKIRERLESRGEERDQWKLENWNTFIHREPPRGDVAFEHLDVRTDEGRVDLDRILGYIDHGPRDAADVTRRSRD